MRVLEEGWRAWSGSSSASSVSFRGGASDARNGHWPIETDYDHQAHAQLTFVSLYSLLKIHREEHGKGKSAIPETKGVEEGSAKRNIQRKVRPGKEGRACHGKSDRRSKSDGTMSVS